MPEIPNQKDLELARHLLDYAGRALKTAERSHAFHRTIETESWLAQCREDHDRKRILFRLLVLRAMNGRLDRIRRRVRRVRPPVQLELGAG